MSLKHASLKKFRKEKHKIKVDSWEEFDQREEELYKDLILNKEPTILGRVRIVGGERKNFMINIPKSSRALTDRVKTTLFDLIGSDIVKKNILDLFAGSGSFGLEALSRGAKSAVFVDASKSAEKVLIENTRKTGYLTETSVVKQKVEEFLPSAIEQEQEYEIIFIDPPYKIFNTKQLSRIKDILNQAAQLLPGVKNPKSRKFKGAIFIKHPRHYPIDKLELSQIRKAETKNFGMNSISLYVVG